MKHFGDITKIRGNEVPIVDVVFGGSPCQDLSVAGKRAGLAGERSGLFIEQMRIVKEMREYDKQYNGATDWSARPRYMVWENVPGALSSSDGEDFRIVLEEIARVVEKDAVIPRPVGKWGGAGAILGNGWSLAWRIHDAQFWGVRECIDGKLFHRGTPQRRRRIALVADFGGHSAPEILFERKGLSRGAEQSEEQGENAPARTGKGVDGTSGTLRGDLRGNGEAISFQERAGCEGGAKEY